MFSAVFFKVSISSEPFPWLFVDGAVAGGVVLVAAIVIMVIFMRSQKERDSKSAPYVPLGDAHFPTASSAVQMVPRTIFVRLVVVHATQNAMENVLSLQVGDCHGRARRLGFSDRMGVGIDKARAAGLLSQRMVETGMRHGAKK